MSKAVPKIMANLASNSVTPSEETVKGFSKGFAQSFIDKMNLT